MKRYYNSNNLLLAILMLFAASGYSQNCQNFNSGGSPGGWTGYDALLQVTSTPTPTADGTPYLKASAVEENSWLENLGVNHTQFPGCGTLCFDYKIIDDGNSNNGFNRTLKLFTGNVAYPTLSATFILESYVYETSNWVNICVPIQRIALGDPLPENNIGRWVMDGNHSAADWNVLVNTFNGIALKVDLWDDKIGSGVIGIDNFCTDVCCPFTFSSDFTLNTACNSGNFSVTATALDPSPPSQNWILMKTTVPNATTGGEQVSPTQHGSTATFSLSISAFYYIIHQVWQEGCQNLTETRYAVPIPAVNIVSNLENSEGTVKTEFCHGEDVYLDGTASSGESAYYIDVERIPNNGGEFATLGWTTGTTMGIVNLSQLFAELTDPVTNQPTPFYFTQGTYRVKLALQNTQNCIAWTEKIHTFTVTCCEGVGALSASFRLFETPVPGSPQVELFPMYYQQYANINAQHTWFVLSSPNTNGGPYQLETIISGPTFTFRGGNELCYFVIHRLDTDCDDLCFGESSCTSGCDLCGPVNCDFVDNLCVAPTNPQEYCNGNVAKLAWNAVPNGGTYKVEITYNDPTCCTSRYPSQTITYTTTSTALYMNSFPQPVWECIRWRVAAVCEEGVLGWSESRCFDGCDEMRYGDSREAGVQTPETDARIFPNPANDQVEVRFETPFSGSVQLLDATGRLLERQQAIEQNTLRFSLDKLPPGFYQIVTQSGADRQIYKLIKN